MNALAAQQRRKLAVYIQDHLMCKTCVMDAEGCSHMPEMEGVDPGLILEVPLVLGPSGQVEQTLAMV
jgi:hypothetical protein